MIAQANLPDTGTHERGRLCGGRPAEATRTGVARRLVGRYAPLVGEGRGIPEAIDGLSLHQEGFTQALGSRLHGGRSLSHGLERQAHGKVRSHAGFRIVGGERAAQQVDLRPEGVAHRNGYGAHIEQPLHEGAARCDLGADGYRLIDPEGSRSRRQIGGAHHHAREGPYGFGAHQLELYAVTRSGYAETRQLEGEG